MKVLDVATEAVYKARWIDGIKGQGMATDEEIAKAVVAAVESFDIVSPLV